MSRKKGFGLGSALDEAFTETVQAVEYYTQFGRLEVLPLHKIKIDPENPRKLKIKPEDARRLQSSVGNIASSLSEADIDRIAKVLEFDLTSSDSDDLEKLFSLASSIKQQGVLNPIIVYPFGGEYRIAAGERRFLASILAGQAAIQSRIYDEKPKEADLRRLQWAENIEREDLTLWEKLLNLKLIVEAEGFDKTKKVTPKQLGKILGCQSRQAYRYHAVLYAHEEIKALIKTGALENIKKAVMLSKISNISVLELVLAGYDKGLSIVQLKALIDKMNAHCDGKSNSKKSRGAQKRIHLGHTTELNVARYLVETIIKAESNTLNKKLIERVNWDDYSQVSKLFQQIISELNNALEKREIA